MRYPVFIAAPFAADTSVGLRRNLGRAAALGRLAAAKGLLPFVPHFAVGGLFRWEDNEADRAASLQLGLAWVAQLGGSRAQFWVLTRDDGSLSSGVKAELWRAFETFLHSKAEIEGHPSDGKTYYAFERRTWAEWREEFASTSLLDLHDNPEQLIPAGIFEEGTP